MQLLPETMRRLAFDHRLEEDFSVTYLVVGPGSLRPGLSIDSYMSLSSIYAYLAVILAVVKVQSVVPQVIRVTHPGITDLIREMSSCLVQSIFVDLRQVHVWQISW